MGNGRQLDFPAALSRAQRKIEQWRQQHRPRTRLPSELWREAAKLAGAYGIHRTARALHLDYYTLKRHATEAAESREPSPGFLEILPGGLPVSPSQCVIEMEEADGMTMRIRLQGGHLPDAASLVRVFRECRS